MSSIRQEFVLAEITRREQYLFPQSLARRANWPDWALDIVGDTYGREALLRIHSQNEYRCSVDHRHSLLCDPRFAYLGMPDDPCRPTGETFILPRSSRNSEYGGYYYYVEPHISLVGDPEASIMRAVINRDAFDWQPEVRSRKWSAWFEQLGRLWLITHLDMVTAIDRFRRTRFVAVIDRYGLPRGTRGEIEAEYRFNTYIDRLTPAFVVPVVGPVDLSPYTIVINRPGVDRVLATEVYKRVCTDLAEARDYYRETAPLVPLNRDACWPIPLR